MRRLAIVLALAGPTHAAVADALAPDGADKRLDVEVSLAPPTSIASTPLAEFTSGFIGDTLTVSLCDFVLVEVVDPPDMEAPGAVSDVMSGRSDCTAFGATVAR